VKKIMGISVVVAMVFLMFLVAGGISGEGEIEEESDKDNPNVEPVPSKTTHYIDRADITVKGNTDWAYTPEPEVEEPAEEKPVVQAPVKEEPKEEEPKEEPKEEEPAPAPSEPELAEEEEETERPPGITFSEGSNTPDFNKP